MFRKFVLTLTFELRHGNKLVGPAAEPEQASNPGAFVQSIAHGEVEKECGGGGAGKARGAEGREGAGAEVDGEAAGGKRAEGGAGPLGDGEGAKIVIAYA